MRPSWLNARWRCVRHGATLWIVGLVILAGLGCAVGRAAPAPVPPVRQVNHDIPGWMSPDTAAQLDLGFDVLVPDSLPAPFSGEPDVEAGDGYYRLYWMVTGGPPTFLEITGTVGGQIPAYSVYDRNNQLTINADVQGNDAYHDDTPAYDLVYWQVGNVVYSVNSRNLADTDTLSLANSLVVLTPPSSGGGTEPPTAPPAEATSGAATSTTTPAIDAPDSVQAGHTVGIGVAGASSATLEADDGTFADTGSASEVNVSDGTYQWTAPSTSSDETVSIRLIDPGNGDWLASADIHVQGQAVATAPPPTSPPGTTSGGTSNPAPTEPPPAAATDQSGSAAQPLAPTLPSGVAAANNSAPTPTPDFFASMATSTPRPTGAKGDGTWGSRKVVVWPTPPPSPTPDIFASLPTSTPRPSGQPGDGTWGSQSGRALPTSSPPPASSVSAPTTTAAASNPVAVTARIGPDGGRLVSPAGATLTVPPGALANEATARIVSVPDTQLPVVNDIDLVPGSGFDISLETVRGQQPVSLQKPVTLTVTLAGKEWRQGAAIYWIHDGALTRVTGSQLSATAAAAPLTHFSRYVVGVAGPPETPVPNRLAWILAATGALAVLVLLLALVLIGRAQRRRRTR